MATATTTVQGTGPPPSKKGIPLLWWAARNPPLDPHIPYTSHTILITGANTGLGYQAALKFASLGAQTLILAVRDQNKGFAAKGAIERATNCAKTTTIKVMQLDMSTFASVRDFAARLNNEVGVLDVALLNAGVAAFAHKVGPEGWEMSVQVNVLSSALLGILLLPQLRASGTKTGRIPHLVFSGSSAHVDVKPEQIALEKGDAGARHPLLDKINAPSYFNPGVQYGVTKLMVMYIGQALAERVSPLPSRSALSQPEIIVNVACPGLCKTDLGRTFPWFVRYPVLAFQSIFARTSEQGSRTLVSAAGLGHDAHGKFWTNDVFTPPGDMVKTEEGQKLQAEAWREIVDVLKEKVPEIEGILQE